MAEFKGKQKYVIYFLMFLIIHLIEKESGLRTELNSQFEYDMLVVFFTIFGCLSMIIIFLPTYILSRIVRKKIRKHVEDNRPKDHGWCIQSNPIGFFSKAYMWLPVVLIYNRVQPRTRMHILCYWKKYALLIPEYSYLCRSTSLYVCFQMLLSGSAK